MDTNACNNLHELVDFLGIFNQLYSFFVCLFVLSTEFPLEPSFSWSASADKPVI